MRDEHINLILVMVLLLACGIVGAVDTWWTQRKVDNSPAVVELRGSVDDIYLEIEALRVMLHHRLPVHDNCPRCDDDKEWYRKPKG